MATRRRPDRLRTRVRLFAALALAAVAIVWAERDARAQTTLPAPAAPSSQGDDNPDVLAARPRGKLPPAQGDLYLEVTLNGQRTALIAHFRQRDGHLYADAGDLDAIGLHLSNAQSKAAEIALDSLPGLHYQYDETSQSITIDAPDLLRKVYVFDTRAADRAPQASASRGFVFNYDAYVQQAGGTEAALWSEERYFDAHGVLSNNGTAYLYGTMHRYVRFDTWWRGSNPNRLSTTQFGDTISSSLDWSRSLRIGGFQWRSNFALRPDLVTFPVPSLSGSAVVPSSVDLYVNNVKQFSGTVPGGPFVISNVPGITGAGEATVVTRDALGRAVTTTVPLYIDTRLLAAGLSSYSVEAGFLRRAYGLESFSYDPNPVASASWRRGVSDRLTVEAHAEVTGGLYDAGAGALLRIGQLGVINASLAASAGHLDGVQGGIGYQLIESAFSIELNTLRATRHYGDLAARDGAPVARATDRATVSVPLPGNETLAFSYIGYRYPNTPTAHIGSISYSVNAFNLASVTVSGFRDFAARASSGVFLSVSIGLGNRTSVNGSVGRQYGGTTDNLNASRTPDYDGGWGWAVQDGGSNAMHYQQAQAQYLGRYGQLTMMGQAMKGQMAASFDASGALVLMDRAVLPARRIDDGFALVSTDGLAGVPVLHENRVIGTTDSRGHLLVPDLNAYQSNLVAVDSMGLPAETHIATTRATVVPQAQSGVLASFAVTQYRAASVILRGPDGELLPPGTRVHLRESGTDTIVGYDGLAFLDNLQAENHLLISAGHLHCTVDFRYVRPTDGSLPTFGPYTCHPVSGDSR
ncbi:fimbria/pilus outer membrane usher protein [Paraburkholderia acidisoli]|uniref:Fimbria/pilus outer membrane usher protein n=1 Tax=Paraburkholderia acidisoli TaxID=2571748 RepID=A0A7Z2GQH3_9BURK|nr:fimbria/pilus outer membrane usher protein [Paraburkholderia acidisoli]QGZ65997.1 fimbria/pilus outer membrane usher protein [Paraburkholderia acidisoli]